MAISNLSHIARYVLLSEAAYANFVDQETGLPYTQTTDPDNIIAALVSEGASSITFIIQMSILTNIVTPFSPP